MTAVLNDVSAIPDLADMSKQELLSYAKTIGVEGVSNGLKKAEIIEKIENIDK